MSFTSFMIRRTFKKGDDKRDAGLTTPENVVRYDDIMYGLDPKWNTLDVYRPKDIEGKLPVIVSVHGGGWVYGDKERYQYYCMSLVEHGFAVVNFTYRLAPEFKFPAQLEDTNQVFSWIVHNAEKYGLDTNAVFGVGDSAGAHLLGLFGALLTNLEYAKTMPFEKVEGIALKAVALNCGVYELYPNGKKDLTSLLMKDLLPHKGTKEEVEQLCVTKHLTGAFPPSFVMTAEGDFLGVQAKPLADHLNSLGVQAEYHYYGDKEHVLGHVFHCNMRSEFAKQCNKEECDFFQSFLEE